MKYELSRKFFDKFDWGCYVEGYKEAVKILLDSLPENQNKTNRNIILPVLFLIRHFLELSFKEILTHEKFINNSVELEKGHNLEKLWKKVKPKIISILENNEDIIKNKNLYPYNKKIKKVDELVSWFKKYDPESFSFRYPKATDFKTSLIERVELNLVDLRVDFEAVQTFLSSIIIIYITDDKYF